MGAPILVLISADPKTTHRANEALRIALGMLAGENDVTIVLRDQAVALLDEDTDECVDGDDIARHVATLRKLGQAFHVEKATLPDGSHPTGQAVIPVSPEDITDLIARSERVLVFQ